MRPTRLLNAFFAVAFVSASILMPAGTTRTVAAPAPATSLPPSLRFTPLASGLTKPLFVTNAHDGSGRLFIIQQTGQIRIWNGSLLAQPFLDIGALPGFTGVNGEQGLLGLAFDPGYPTNGLFYITYTTNTGTTPPYTTTLARYQVSSGNANVADPATATVLLSVPKKYVNHNGGMIAFGPDGYLYFSMGDGGSGGDPDNNGQNLNVLLAKILRLDVAHTDPDLNYAIPHSNPFYNVPGKRGEIWAYGLRNPWRFSFDSSTGDLFIADVGQDTEEEVDFQAAGASGGQNYGWSVLEGNLCFKPSSGCLPPSSYVPPVAVYDHGVNDSYGCSITGGYVYRGSASPRLQGVYLYGDYCSGKVLGLVRNADLSWTSGLITTTNFAISSFGVGEDGEMYLTDLAGGVVYHISAPEQTISGNAGAANASLSYNDGVFKTVAADGLGAYSFAVPYGWSGTVAPFKFGYGFSPSSRNYAGIVSNQTIQNYTGASYPSAGTYDDASSGWSFSGAWVGLTVPGAFGNSLHFGLSPGALASFSFYGSGFDLQYLQYTNWGKIGVYLDANAVPITTVDSNGSGGLPTYSSPVLIPGPHTVTLKHAGPSGSWIGIDSLVVRTPLPQGAGSYDDGDAAWSYTGTWVPLAITGPSNNSLHIGVTPGNAASFVFSGTGFSLTYLKFPGWGIIGVYVDHNPQAAAILDTNGAAGLATYSSPPLSSGGHEVTLVHAGPSGKFIAIDELQVLP